MKIIKRLSNDIAGNIEEACGKIRTAYDLKAEHPEAAAWYREMAAAHINFNTNGHAVVKKLIEGYKASEEYKRNPAYAEGMLDAWQSMHDDLIAKADETRALISNFN